MFRRLALLLGIFLVMSVSARAQDRLELFGGYSYEHFGTAPSHNLNGWEVSGQHKFLGWLGLVGDVDAHYGSASSDTRNFSIMVGPQISLPGRISPFAHVLVGVGHATSGISDTAISTAIGGGIDYRIVPLFSIRAIQIDDVVTHFFGGTQQSARISTGIIFRF